MLQDRDHTDHAGLPPAHGGGIARVTTVLIIVNVAVYLLMVLRGDNGLFAEGSRLAAWGGNFGPLTRGGDWWRLLTAFFLHAGIFHLLLNMVALGIGGPILEDLLGSWRFLALYLLTGIAASLGSTVITAQAVSIGASGAVFGVYGTLLALALRSHRAGTKVNREGAECPAGPAGSGGVEEEADAPLPPGAVLPPDLGRRVAIEIGVLVALNLLIGLAVPAIDNTAHVTGFVAGVLAGWAVGVSIHRRLVTGEDHPARSSVLVRTAGVVVLVLAASAVYPPFPRTVRAATLEVACRSGVAGACLAAGQTAARNRAPDGAARSIVHFARGCDLGLAESCIALGRAQLARGAQGTAAGVQALAKACDVGAALGCTALAALHETGTGVPRDLIQASQLYARACERGDAGGCVKLSEAYTHGRGVRHDAERAVSLAAKACETGDPRGCTLQARALAEGAGVDEDVPRALELYAGACERQREPLACGELGRRHASGDGVERDVVAAAQRYLSVACTRGHGPSCTRAAALYEREPELGPDLTRAATLYERGCRAGNAAACFGLGTMYDEGRGRKRDPERARALYEQACQRGMRQVCGLLARWHAQRPGE
jgi:uncharacterized protein